MTVDDTRLRIGGDVVLQGHEHTCRQAENIGPVVAFRLPAAGHPDQGTAVGTPHHRNPGRVAY